MDILIYTKPEVVEHKMKENCSQLSECYWYVSVYPKDDSKVENIYFSDGERIFAKGAFLGSDYEYIDKLKKILCFKPLERINKKQPKKPPKRGWCYINK